MNKTIEIIFKIKCVFQQKILTDISILYWFKRQI